MFALSRSPHEDDLTGHGHLRGELHHGLPLEDLVSPDTVATRGRSVKPRSPHEDDLTPWSQHGGTVWHHVLGTVFTENICSHQILHHVTHTGMSDHRSVKITVATRGRSELHFDARLSHGTHNGISENKHQLTSWHPLLGCLIMKKGEGLCHH